MARSRCRVVVSGVVQGVFFRYATAEEARSLGVAGWVRNRSDGSVEAAFEGERDAVERAIQWCRHGPPTARVERVEETWEEPEGESEFGIR